MRFTKRSEITIDTHQVTVIRSGRARAVYCDRCGAEVRTYSDEQMAEVLAIGVDAMTDLVIRGSIHSTGRGICGRSLAQHFGGDTNLPAI